MQELANGLLFPEGPTWLGDGSLIVVEIAAGAPDADRAGWCLPHCRNFM